MPPTNHINGKPVIEHDTRIINFDSGFAEKLLCDGPTFSAGTSCVFRCSYCYVKSFMQKNPFVSDTLQSTNLGFQDLVIRRKKPVQKVVDQLTRSGEPKFDNPRDQRVIYGSPLVDVAATIELAKETVQICTKILELTHWQIRLLSKSNLLPFIAKAIPKQYKDRVIYGVSTGTVDDKLTRCFEEGTALFTKRIQALHWLQDNGYRTFGMICPSLPQQNYEEFALRAAQAIRVDKCEHVWAEVMNARGDSMTNTCTALEAGGFLMESKLLKAVQNDADAWEDYARATFLAHTAVIPAHKLRFLQYVKKSNIEWWKRREDRGAILLGKAALVEAETD